MLLLPDRDVVKCIHKRLRDLGDSDIQSLANELERISGVSVADHRDVMLIHYLKACLYPNGASERQVPITKRALDEHDPTDSFLLRKKVRSLTGSTLYQVCRELAEMRGSGIEMVETPSLYVFLNKFLKSNGKPKRAKPARVRW